ncbi:hypothetical protein M5689_008583 [Euphorbia peplus]|nr:hypothetical protein M5689_008583 [Euphorbia peplus]
MFHPSRNSGYLKDLLEILYRILEGSDVRNIQKAEQAKRKKQKAKHLEEMAKYMAEERRNMHWSYKFHVQDNREHILAGTAEERK